MKKIGLKITITIISCCLVISSLLGFVSIFQSSKYIKKEAEENMEVDDSDIPVHEKFVKEKHVKKVKKNKDL